MTGEETWVEKRSEVRLLHRKFVIQRATRVCTGAARGGFRYRAACDVSGGPLAIPFSSSILS